MIPKKTIISYMGLQGSGKDLACQLTIDYFGKDNAEKHAFADVLRDVCWSLFRNKVQDKERIYGIAEQKLKSIDGWIIPEATCSLLGVPVGTEWSGRKLLQWFGTEVCREATGYDSIWLDITKTRIIESDKPIVIITDCRFPNEYKMLDNLQEWANFHSVWVERPSVRNSQISNHASEAHIEKFPRTAEIDNSGSLQEFENNVISFIKTNAI